MEAQRKKNPEQKKKIIQAMRASYMQRQNDYDPEHKNNRYNIPENIEEIDEETFELGTKAAKIGEKGKILEDILEKQSPLWFVFWLQDRICTLTDNRFIYYQNDQKKQIAGILNFNAVSVRLEKVLNSDNQITFFKLLPKGSNKQFIFKGRDTQTTQKWIKAITQIIDKSDGAKYGLQYICHYQRFWRRDYFMENEFRKQAQSGDLVLFRGNRQNAVFQRKLTRDEFDHVAVVLKNSRGEVLLFEATGGVGVGIFPWNKMIQKQWYKDQDLIVYRSLVVERSEAFLTEIEKFVNENLGKKYQFSLEKMMHRQSLEEAPRDHKTFFCSELVATLYKKLELLPKQLSSTQYWPGNFAEVSKLSLLSKGKYGQAKLGPEQIIIFEQAILQNKK